MVKHRIATALVVMIGLISSSLFLCAAAQDQTVIPVFVKGEGAAGGFTDPSKDRQDSIKDLLKKLKDSRAIRLVESESDAVVVLEVLSRETKRETNAFALLGSRQNKSYLTVRLSAGEYSTEFTADGGSSGLVTGYKKAAGKIAKQLEEWVKANRDKLLALKK